ncbi:unannotated protein [freshwater metagenome]|uniref:Unannotated protein n=1 Tax=freshwater metagenome TaxID=449393 RepID=A0A6J5ZYR5_9ZZZZ
MRPRATGCCSNELLVHWNVAPTEEDLTFNARVELDELLEFAAPLLVARQEADADRVLAGFG